MNSARKWAITTAVTMLFAFGATSALATLMPSTFVGIQAGASGDIPRIFVDTAHGPTSGAVSSFGDVPLRGTASASAAAAADFGTLGSAASASGSSLPTPFGGVSGSANALAEWTDVFTPVPKPGSGLLPGAAASAQVDLSIDLLNSLFALNGSASFDVSVGVVRVDPNTLARTVLGGFCFTTNVNDPNCFGDQIVLVPGNLGPPKVTLKLKPIVLPVSISQPFGLDVGLDVSVGGSATSILESVGGSIAVGSFTASADSLDPQQTFLQPLGDFSLVAASGHDYSVPPSAVPEPSSLLLLAAGLVALGVSGRRLTWGPSMNWLAPRMRKPASSRTAT